MSPSDNTASVSHPPLESERAAADIVPEPRSGSGSTRGSRHDSRHSSRLASEHLSPISNVSHVSETGNTGSSINSHNAAAHPSTVSSTSSSSTPSHESLDKPNQPSLTDKLKKDLDTFMETFRLYCSETNLGHTIDIHSATLSIQGSANGQLFTTESSLSQLQDYSQGGSRDLVLLSTILSQGNANSNANANANTTKANVVLATPLARLHDEYSDAYLQQLSKSVQMGFPIGPRTPGCPKYGLLRFASNQPKDHCFQMFGFLQQTACKSLAKAWIKCIEPRKQTNHPYNQGEKSKPEWWPLLARHKEPDHLYKHERVLLLNSILFWSQTDLNQLKKCTPDCLDALTEEKLMVLEDIFHIAQIYKQYQAGQFGETKLKNIWVFYTAPETVISSEVFPYSMVQTLQNEFARSLESSVSSESDDAKDNSSKVHDNVYNTLYNVEDGHDNSVAVRVNTPADTSESGSDSDSEKDSYSLSSVEDYIVHKMDPAYLRIKQAIGICETPTPGYILDADGNVELDVQMTIETQVQGNRRDVDSMDENDLDISQNQTQEQEEALDQHQDTSVHTISTPVSTPVSLTRVPTSVIDIKSPVRSTSAAVSENTSFAARLDNMFDSDSEQILDTSPLGFYDIFQANLGHADHEHTGEHCGVVGFDSLVNYLRISKQGNSYNPFTSPGANKNDDSPAPSKGRKKQTYSSANTTETSTATDGNWSIMSRPLHDLSSGSSSSNYEAAAEHPFMISVNSSILESGMDFHSSPTSFTMKRGRDDDEDENENEFDVFGDDKRIKLEHE